MPIHTHADLAPVHCGRHLHPDAARDQAQGHFVRPSGVLLRGLEHERVVLAGSPSWAAPHRRAQLQVTRRRRRSTWACCAQPPSSSSSAPRRRRSPRRRGRRSPLGLPKDSYQSAKTELCVCVMLVLVRARARVNSRRVNESQITSGVMHGAWRGSPSPKSGKRCVPKFGPGMSLPASRARCLLADQLGVQRRSRAVMALNFIIGAVLAIWQVWDGGELLWLRVAPLGQSSSPPTTRAWCPARSSNSSSSCMMKA